MTAHASHAWSCALSMTSYKSWEELWTFGFGSFCFRLRACIDNRALLSMVRGYSCLVSDIASVSCQLIRYGLCVLAKYSVIIHRYCTANSVFNPKFCPWCALGLCVCLYVSCWGRAVGLSIQTAGPWKSLAGTWLRTPSPRNTELSTWARWKGFRGYKRVSRLCLP